LTDIPVRTLLEFALDAAWQAGRITLGHFQADVQVERKADSSPVTVADRESERKLRDLIGRYWPEHGIIGEEYGQSANTADFTWIIDPIDGTKSFIQGVPLYGVLIGLTKGQTPVVGVAHFPALNETVYAARGEGCNWNGRRVHVSTVSEISRAVLVGSDDHLW
jgi:fructose-1,6-bisphosphatase/inositol monophosphatase family enzyme